MSSIFDDLPRSADDETRRSARPSREYLDGPGGPADAAPGAFLGEVPYVHSAPRIVSARSRRVLVAAGSLAAGTLAAGGAAFALGGGGSEPAVALAGGAASSKTAEAPVDDSTRTQDVSRDDARPGMCVRLDAAALAAIDKARAGGADPKADGRTVTLRLADGDVTVPLSSVTVVKCSLPARPAPASTSSSAKASRTSTSSAPKPRTSSSTSSKPRSSTTSAPRTTKPAPKPSTTAPRTTTTTKTSKPTPKPTTTSAS